MSVKRSILQTNPKTACDIQREDKDYWHGHRADCNDYHMSTHVPYLALL